MCHWLKYPNLASVGYGQRERVREQVNEGGGIERERKKGVLFKQVFLTALKASR